jgi:hypothetical protein
VLLQAASEQSQHRGYGDPQMTDARNSAHPCRVDGNALEVFHCRSIIRSDSNPLEVAEGNQNKFGRWTLQDLLSIVTVALSIVTKYRDSGDCPGIPEFPPEFPRPGFPPAARCLVFRRAC